MFLIPYYFASKNTIQIIFLHFPEIPFCFVSIGSEIEQPICFIIIEQIACQIWLDAKAWLLNVSYFERFSLAFKKYLDAVFLTRY